MCYVFEVVFFPSFVCYVKKMPSIKEIESLLKKKKLQPIQAKLDRSSKEDEYQLQNVLYRNIKFPFAQVKENVVRLVVVDTGTITQINYNNHEERYQ